MEVPSSKKRRIRAPLLKVSTFMWNSPFNMEEKVAISSEEIGDGATSRVYVGTIEDQRLAVKRLEGYSSHCVPTLVEDTYEKFIHMHHPKIVSVLGLCPNSGCTYHP